MAIMSSLDPGQIVKTAFDDSTGGFKTTSISGALITVPFDEQVFTYVPSGPGVGQFATVVYKLNGTTVATLSFSYNGSDQLIGVVRS